MNYTIEFKGKKGVILIGDEINFNDLFNDLESMFPDGSWADFYLKRNCCKSSKCCRKSKESSTVLLETGDAWVTNATGDQEISPPSTTCCKDGK
jgi:hypothetical protein